MKQDHTRSASGVRFRIATVFSPPLGHIISSHFIALLMLPTGLKVPDQRKARRCSYETVPTVWGSGQARPEVP